LGSFKTGAWCYYKKEDNSTDGATYGKMYNWYAVAGITVAESDPPTQEAEIDAKAISPTGYHVP
jgi:uncharacterized protein (TIGR02145 family)